MPVYGMTNEHVDLIHFVLLPGGAHLSREMCPAERGLWRVDPSIMLAKSSPAPPRCDERGAGGSEWCRD